MKEKRITSASVSLKLYGVKLTESRDDDNNNFISS